MLLVSQQVRVVAIDPVVVPRDGNGLLEGADVGPGIQVASALVKVVQVQLEAVEITGSVAGVLLYLHAVNTQIILKLIASEGVYNHDELRYHLNPTFLPLRHLDTRNGQLGLPHCVEHLFKSFALLWKTYILHNFAIDHIQKRDVVRELLVLDSDECSHRALIYLAAVLNEELAQDVFEVWHGPHHLCFETNHDFVSTFLA